MGRTRDVLRWTRAKGGKGGWRKLQPMRDPSQPGSAGESLPSLGPMAAPSARKQAMAAFLDGCGWGDAGRAPLAGDASFRRYYRLGGDGRRAVLMDAPPPQEDVVPYVAVSKLLRRLRFRPPQVVAEERAGGFVLGGEFRGAPLTRRPVRRAR